MSTNLPAKTSGRILATKKKDNSEVTIFFKGTHYRKTRDQVGEEGIEQLFNAANDYRTTGSMAALEALEAMLNPKGTLIRKLFNGQFYTDGNNVFFQGSDVPVPQFLTATMKEYEKEGWDLQPLTNFWVLALLNPNPKARDSFFNYCQNHGVVITDFGYAVMYKAVTHKEKVEDNKDLARVIGEGISNAKKKKKGAGKYTVFHNTIEDTYRTSESSHKNEGEAIIGNLKELHDNLEEITKGKMVTVYTDKHTGKMDIHLGIPVKMPRSMCDSNISVECSRGLHVGSYSYVRRFGGSGDTIFTCLVNPMNVVAVPVHDKSKIRVCEYLPRAIMVGGESKQWEELSSPYYEDDYLAYELKELRGLLGDGKTMEGDRKIAETRLVSLKREEQRAKGEIPDPVMMYEEENEKGESTMRLLEAPK